MSGPFDFVGFHPFFSGALPTQCSIVLGLVSLFFGKRTYIWFVFVRSWKHFTIELTFIKKSIPIGFTNVMNLTSISIPDLNELLDSLYFYSDWVQEWALTAWPPRQSLSLFLLCPLINSSAPWTK